MMPAKLPFRSKLNQTDVARDPTASTARLAATLNVPMDGASNVLDLIWRQMLKADEQNAPMASQMRTVTTATTNTEG
jgi:hypothetical protein